MIRSRSLATAIIPAAALLAAAGCVMPDQLAQIQKDVADVRQEMQSLRREQADTKNRLDAAQAKLEEGSDVKRTEFADLKLRLDDVQRDLAAVDERGNDLERRVERLSAEVSRARDAQKRPQDLPPTGFTPAQPPDATAVPPDATGGAPVAPPPGSGAAPAPDALYNQAYADFSKGNYALAISGFEEFAGTFPDSAQADNALYWIGECRLSEGRFDEAVQAFDRMLEKYPDSDRAAAANLKKGLAYLEENDVRSAIVQLRYVTTAFPASDEAKIAREKLSSLGASAGRP